MRLFFLLFFVTCLSWAQYSSPTPTEIANPDIVCQNKKEDMQVSVNTNLGKIWVKAVSNPSNLGFETWGNVWTGIDSAQRYEGEVASEITFNGVRMYSFLLITTVNGKAELQFEMYPVANGNDFRKVKLNDCVLGFKK